MEFEKLFQVLVVGGSVLAGGCATKSRTVPSDSTEPVAVEAIEATAPTSAPTSPVEMTPEVSDTPEQLPVVSDDQTVAKTEVDCATVCDFSAGEGREALCPDETMDGAENCCWLMSIRHECCP